MLLELTVHEACICSVLSIYTSPCSLTGRPVQINRSRFPSLRLILPLAKSSPFNLSYVNPIRVIVEPSFELPPFEQIIVPSLLLLSPFGESYRHRPNTMRSLDMEINRDG